MGRHSRVALIATLVVAAGAAVWWWTSAREIATPAVRPNVLLVTLDTTRADRIGSYGYALAGTPNLDRLAASGVRFENAFTSAPLTLPAHASLMTGREPFAHGVRNNGYSSLSPGIPTLAEAFTAAGYQTAAFVSAFVLDRQFGLTRGFAHYDDTLDRAAAGASLELERRGDRTVESASRWLAGRTSTQPFFLWVHLFDPHDPYSPPSPFREQFSERPYDGEIAFTDALLGTLLERVGYGRSPTLVVVTADHGEGLGDHGESTHGLFVYDSTLRVPLIIAGTAVDAPAVVVEDVRLVDVAQTIADLAGLNAIPGTEGRSLRDAMGHGDAEARRKNGGESHGDTEAQRRNRGGESRGDTEAQRRNGGGESHEDTKTRRRGTTPPVSGSSAAYAETYFPEFFMGWSPLQSVRLGRWKYIDAPEPELYDLQADRGEQRNLIAEEPARAASLQRVLTGALATQASRPTSAPMSEDARRKLASLGYISAGGNTEPGPSARGPDPKRMAPLFERLLEGNRSLASGDAKAAARIAREVLRSDAENAFAWLLNGRAALAQGFHREAIAAFESYLAQVPQSSDAHHWLALAALRLGDRPRALAEEEAAIALDPRHTSAISLRAGLLFSAGRVDEGIASLRTAMAYDPSNQALALELADLLTDARRYQEADAEYQKVLNTDPSSARAHAGRGVLLALTGRHSDALNALDRALQLAPQDDESRLARGETLFALGRDSDARAELERVRRSSSRPDLREAATQLLAK